MQSLASIFDSRVQSRSGVVADNRTGDQGPGTRNPEQLFVQGLGGTRNPEQLFDQETFAIRVVRIKYCSHHFVFFKNIVFYSSIWILAAPQPAGHQPNDMKLGQYFHSVFP